MTKLVSAAYGALCLGFLVHGYITGRMHFVGSIALWGSADVRGNPAWFWGYGFFNTLSVAACIWLLVD